jgi:hypothetical protein
VIGPDRDETIDAGHSDHNEASRLSRRSIQMLADILTATPVHSIDEVIAVMTQIEGRLPDSDGVKWFNHLYLSVTIAMRTAVAGTTFNDPTFLTELDVLFGNLYFAAVAAAEQSPAAAPPAWRPLFQARNTPGIARLQFALAGMNAHINRDLPSGIVSAFQALGGTPLTDQSRHDDYDRVNDLLEKVEADVKTEFTTGALAEVDALAGPLDDITAMWSIRAARATAWTNGQVLWTLEAVPSLRDQFFDRLDSLTGFAGRGLLRPRGAGVL